MNTVAVSIPARAELIHVLRSVVSSIAARLDFAYEEIDDLRLAVDEACAHLLGVSPPAARLGLRVDVRDEGTLSVEAWRDGQPDAWPPTGARQTLAWQVLNALTSEARFERRDGGPTICFTKQRLRESSV